MMPDQLNILLHEGEGTMLEYKESLSASFARELVALANTLGGRILLGVRDDGSVAGIKDSNDLRARIQDIARKSIRRNALVADLLHRIEFIEKAGTGIRRIRDDVREQGCPEPEFETNGFFTVIFRPNPSVRTQSAPSQGQVTDQVTDQVKKLLILFGNESLDAVKLMNKLRLSHRPTFRKNYLHPSLKAGYVEMTIPDKPRSSKQRYRITSLGKKVLEKRIK